MHHDKQTEKNLQTFSTWEYIGYDFSYIVKNFSYKVDKQKRDVEKLYPLYTPK